MEFNSVSSHTSNNKIERPLRMGGGGGGLIVTSMIADELHDTKS